MGARAIYSLPRWQSMAMIQGSSTMAALRSAVVEALYPTGVLATGADESADVTQSRTLPAGCARAVEYTFADNGGRGEASVIYADVLEPANPIGHAIVFCDGHRCNRWDVDISPVDHIPLLASAMAAGIHVAICEMVNFGRQWPGPSTIIVNGVPAEFNLHVIGPAGDDRPPMTCMFTDQPIRAINQIATDYGIGVGDVSIVGFSGGGMAARLVQIVLGISARYGIFDFLPPPWQGTVTENAGCIETSEPIVRAALGGLYRNMEIVSASVPGRSWTLDGPNDNPWGGAGVYTGAPRYQAINDAQLVGCSGRLIRKLDCSATVHDVTAWAGTAIVNDILAHL